MLRLRWIVAVVGLVLSGALGVSSSSSSSSSQGLAGKQSEMESLVVKSAHSPVLELTDRSFLDLAASGPRPYHLFVLLVALPDQYKCSMCHKALSEMIIAAQSYEVQGKQEQRQQEDDAPSIFFALVDFAKSRETFIALGISQAPVVFHIAPDAKSTPGDNFKIGENEYMPMGKASGWVAEDFARFVKDKSGVEYDIVRSRKVEYTILALLFVGVIASIKPLWKRRAVIFGLVRNQWLWFIWSLIVYTFSISGGIYDMIRSPALFHEDRKTGAVEIFHPQNNVQYVVEGFLAGLTTLCIACSVLCLAVVVPKFKSQGVRDMVAVGCCVAFAMLFSNIVMWFASKNRWYARKFM